MANGTRAQPAIQAPSWPVMPKAMSTATKGATSGTRSRSPATAAACARPETMLTWRESARPGPRSRSGDVERRDGQPADPGRSRDVAARVANLAAHYRSSSRPPKSEGDLGPEVEAVPIPAGREMKRRGRTVGQPDGDAQPDHQQAGRRRSPGPPRSASTCLPADPPGS